MINTIDLFAGAGGLSLGFMMTKQFNLLAAAEINENARNTYKKNIAKNNDTFTFINNIVGYNFTKLNKDVDGIDLVIGGPPCQGFSNANRQKNHLISMNNGLVKEYFRAIKEIRPKAFVMENVSMLQSEKHRFYESFTDNDKIDALIRDGASIPKREESIIVSKCVLAGIAIKPIVTDSCLINQLLLPEKLAHFFSVLKKYTNNNSKLTKFLEKNKKDIIKAIERYIENVITPSINQKIMLSRLTTIKESLIGGKTYTVSDDLEAVVELQKTLTTAKEIYDNKLVGNYVDDGDTIVFKTRSYSVIDYVNAILGNDYTQIGGTLNAVDFGVPQERKRYIVIGVRSDLLKDEILSLPTPKSLSRPVTVGEAIMDLADYKISYDADCNEIIYSDNDALSHYAIEMRSGSQSVKNHFSTKTRSTALERFKQIGQGDNFHSLPDEYKSTYSNPKRTQTTIYLRLNPNVPCGTVVNVRKSMWIHPTLDRAVTVREAARLQSFPDYFEFAGHKDSQYQQVGNAVPPLLARAIAEQILKYIK